MIRGWLCCATLAAVGVAYAAAPAFAQEDGPVVTAEAREVEEDEQTLVRVDVNVRDVSDLGAFVFIMTFTGDVIEVERIERGEFLGSSDREVSCLEPTIDLNALQYTCVTLGDTPREGAEGEGRLATVFFNIKGEGEASLAFSRARLLTPPGEEISTEWQAGVIEVEDDGGMNWALYAIIGGAVVAGIVVLAGALVFIDRRRSGRGGMAYPAEGE